MAIQLNNDVRVPVRIQVDRAGLAEKNAEFLTVNRKIDEVANEKAAASAGYNERLKALREQRRTLMGVLDEGFETIEIEAYERVNEQRMEIETVRRDTGKVVESMTRPFTAAERQLDLDDVQPREDGERADTDLDETEATEATPEETTEEAPKKRRGRKKKTEQAEATEDAAE